MFRATLIRMRFRSKSALFLRTGFLLALLTCGFAAERLVRQKRGLVTTGDKGRDSSFSILNFGCSVACGGNISGYLKEDLTQMFPGKSFQVWDACPSNLTTGEALQFAPHLIEAYRPDLVLFTPACQNPTDAPSSRQSGIGSSGVWSRLPSFLRINSFDQTIRDFFRITRDDLSGEDFKPGDLETLNESVLFRFVDEKSVTWIDDFYFNVVRQTRRLSVEERQHLVRKIEQQLDEILQSGSLQDLNQYQIFQLLCGIGHRYAFPMMPPAELLKTNTDPFYRRRLLSDYAFTSTPIHFDTQATISILREFSDFLEKGSKELASRGTLGFIRESNLSVPFNRYWLAGIWAFHAASAPREPWPSFLGRMLLYSEPVLTDVLGVNLSQASLPHTYPSQPILDGLIRDLENPSFVSKPAPPLRSTQRSLLADELGRLRTGFAEAGADFVLVEGPGGHISWLEEIATEKKIPFIGNNGVFDPILSKEGAEAIFLDLDCAGHLKDRGGVLFAGNLATGIEENVRARINALKKQRTPLLYQH